MHPNRAFAWEERDALLAFIAEVSFAHVFAQTPEGPMVAHVPLFVTETGALRFHLSRGNRLTPHLAGLTALASIGGPDAYVSPDWYADRRDQVPTWNYLAVEAQGPVRALSDSELVDLLDRVSMAHEARIADKTPWTRAKMTPGRFEAMCRAITGFELMPAELRGTKKLGQNKRAEDRAAVASALGAHPVGRLMEDER
ncbi:MAG: FMN-binding negative transcriptional regulator [Alphaproteobacteria bacterium]|nr:FMN-binding negative transcriptional regulator [Alphaproteobacteria bacterium]